MRLNHVRAGEGPPLVLVHGIGDSLRCFRAVMDALAEHHEVTAVDLPGFGASPPLDGEPTVTALAAAVMDLMSGRDFHVAGNSLGGGVALEIGRAGRALSVCALSPIGFARGRERAFLDVSLRLTLVAARSIPRVVLGLPLARQIVGWQNFQHAARIPADEFGGLVEGVAAAPGFDATRPHTVAYTFTGGIDCPVTVAWGDHDRLLLHGRQAPRARRLLPDARHVTLHGCGHIPTWDDPEQTARVILETTGAAAS